MDTTQVDLLLRDLDATDPADAADLAVAVADLLGEVLDRPEAEGPA